MRFFIRLVAFSVLALALLRELDGVDHLATLAVAALFWAAGFSATHRTVVVRKDVPHHVFLKDRRSRDRTKDTAPVLSRDDAINLINGLRKPTEVARKEA